MARTHTGCSGNRRGRSCAAIFAVVALYACVSADTDFEPVGIGEIASGRQLLATCKAGFERKQGRCLSCAPGYLKTADGNYRCFKCKGNAVARKRGSTSCTKCTGVKIANAAKTTCRAPECRDLTTLPKSCLPAGPFQDTCFGCSLIPGPLPPADSPRPFYAAPTLKCKSCGRRNGTFARNVVAFVPTQGASSPLLASARNPFSNAPGIPIYNCNGRLNIGPCSAPSSDNARP